MSKFKKWEGEFTPKQIEQYNLAHNLAKKAILSGLKEPIECKDTIMFLAHRNEPIDPNIELTNKQFINYWKESWNFEFGQLLMKGDL